MARATDCKTTLALANHVEMSYQHSVLLWSPACWLAVADDSIDRAYGVLPIVGALRAQSLAAVPVRYDVVSNTIYIGEAYTDPDIDRLPFRARRAKIADHYSASRGGARDPALLQDQGSGAWLLKASIVILASAQLDATSSTISWLRLASAPSFIRMVADGGYLKIQNIKLTSWDHSSRCGR